MFELVLIDFYPNLGFNFLYLCMPGRCNWMLDIVDFTFLGMSIPVYRLLSWLR